MEAIHLLTSYQQDLSTILDRSRLMAKLEGPWMVASFDRVTRLNRMYGGHVRQATFPNIFHDNVTGSVCQCGRPQGCPIFWTLFLYGVSYNLDMSTILDDRVLCEPITYIMLSRKTAKNPITNVMLSRRGVYYSRHFLRASRAYIVYYPKLLYV